MKTRRVFRDTFWSTGRCLDLGSFNPRSVVTMTFTYSGFGGVRVHERHPRPPDRFHGRVSTLPTLRISDEPRNGHLIEPAMHVSGWHTVTHGRLQRVPHPMLHRTHQTQLEACVGHT
jgi:hypothetical protein